MTVMDRQGEERPGSKPKHPGTELLLMCCFFLVQLLLYLLFNGAGAKCSSVSSSSPHISGREAPLIYSMPHQACMFPCYATFCDRQPPPSHLPQISERLIFFLILSARPFDTMCACVCGHDSAW
jgi:hypothetical protein